MSSDRRFRPALIPTLFTVPALIVLIGLGAWQLERRAWKHELIALRTERTTAAVIDLPPAGADAAALEYRRVRARGRFLNDREAFLGARSLRGNLGYHLFTPFVLDDGTAVLVNRGWIPRERKDPVTRTAARIEGVVEIVGFLRLSAEKSWVTPANRPQENFWLYADVPAMARFLKADRARPYYLQLAGAPPPGEWPRPVPIEVKLNDPHLQYAITWFALAVILAVVYILYSRRRRAD